MNINQLTTKRNVIDKFYSNQYFVCKGFGETLLGAYCQLCSSLYNNNLFCDMINCQFREYKDIQQELKHYFHESCIVLFHCPIYFCLPSPSELYWKQTQK